jgi:phospholipase/carboxylesterase
MVHYGLRQRVTLATQSENMMVAIDPDAVLWSAPERERAGRPLLLLLHGFGSHEGDLFGLSPMLPLDPVIASIRGPLTAGPGFAWFPLTFETPTDEEREYADATGVAILDWLQSTESVSVGLLGFSQGGAMALQLLRIAPERFSYAVQLSGFVLDGGHPGDSALEVLQPPVFWGRGTIDPVIPNSDIERTEQWLPDHSSATVRIYEELAHSISHEEAVDASAFIRGVSQ